MKKKYWVYISLLYSIGGILTYFFFITVALGQIKVVDADTIILNKEKIRLHGIDAPETEQSCYIEEEAWPCGKKATEHLKKLLEGVSTPSLLCKVSSKDRYGRSIAVCYVGEININRNLVENGWALAYSEYSKDYIIYEKLASENKVGIWQGVFVEPWDWRKGIRVKAIKKNGCVIKGNISSNGEKIYHLPYTKSYFKTTNPWFNSDWNWAYYS